MSDLTERPINSESRAARKVGLLEQEVERLREQVERYDEALTAIRKINWRPGQPIDGLHVVKEIARRAQEGVEA